MLHPFLMTLYQSEFLLCVCAGLAIIFFLLFSGFLIAKNKVPNWWIWVYYISPLQWGVTALICNEFLSQKYSQVC